LPWSSSQRPWVCVVVPSLLTLLFEFIVEELMLSFVVVLESTVVVVVVVASICSSICFSFDIHSEATLPPPSTLSDDDDSKREEELTALFHLLPIWLLDDGIVGS